MTGTTKLTVNIPTASIAQIRKSAARKGITMTEVIRRAIGRQNFLEDVVDDGGKVLTESRWGSFRKLLGI